MFRIIITHTDSHRAEVKNKLKKIQHNSTMYFIHHSLPVNVLSHNAPTKLCVKRQKWL